MSFMLLASDIVRLIFSRKFRSSDLDLFIFVWICLRKQPSKGSKTKAVEKRPTKKSISKKFRKVLRKIPVTESFFE